jgi:hypothetical protein
MQVVIYLFKHSLIIALFSTFSPQHLLVKRVGDTVREKSIAPPRRTMSNAYAREARTATIEDYSCRRR